MCIPRLHKGVHKMDELDDLIQIYLRELGDAILSRRKEQGLKQRELANFAGYTGRYQCMVEDGQRNVTLAYLICVSLALHCMPGELLDDVMRSIEQSPASAKRFAELQQQALAKMQKNMHIQNNK